MGRIIMANPGVRGRPQDRTAAALTVTDLAQTPIDRLPAPKCPHLGKEHDPVHKAIRPARHRRLACLYDRADRRAIGSTDPRVLATLTLAHWLYVRATAPEPYSWRRMASDYRFNLLKQPGCRRLDIRAMDHCSRPQIARRILIAHYIAGRADRNSRSIDRQPPSPERWPSVPRIVSPVR